MMRFPMCSCAVCKFVVVGESISIADAKLQQFGMFDQLQQILPFAREGRPRLCPSTRGNMLDAERVVDENSQQVVTNRAQSQDGRTVARGPLIDVSFLLVAHFVGLPCGQGGFQSSWTGRNGGASAGNTSQFVRQVASQEGAGRRFGTVSNPSAAGGPTARAGHQAVAPGQQEPVSGPGQSSSAGLSSQVRAIFPCFHPDASTVL